jgi:CysZ protein
VDLLSGAGYAFRGLGLIFKPGIRKYVAIPLIINTVLFALLIWYGADQFQTLLDRILPVWLDWLEWILWPLFAAAVLMVVFFGFSLLANLVSAPFNGHLAKAVEKKLTGGPPKETGPSRLLAEIAGSILSELKKILYIVSRTVPLLILFIIPVVNLLAPFLWIGFSAWMLAIEYSDFPMGNHGIDFQERRLKLRERRFLALGFGLGVLCMVTIPLLNFVAIPAAVAGATAMWVERYLKPHSTT